MNAFRTWLRHRSPAARGAVAAAASVAALFVLYRIPGLAGVLRDRAPFGIVAVGVIRGTITALLAFGLILIYRTNRFVNFAFASMGSLGGVIALALHIEKGLPYLTVIPIGIAIGVFVGFWTELLIRRFKSSSRLIVTVATIGLAQVYGVIELIGAKSLGFLSLASGFEVPLGLQVDLGVKTLFGDEMLILLTVPVAIAGLAWFLLRTDAGVAIRATAENEDRALLLGIPTYRLGRIVWMIGGALAALTFILQAPSSGVAPGAAAAGPIILLPALAAAVVARMEVLPVAFAAGVGLGVAEQLVRWNFPAKPSLVSVVFLAVILVALLAQRESLSRAMNSESASFTTDGIVKPIPRVLRSLPEVAWARRAIWAMVVVAAVAVPASWGPSNQLLAAIAVVWAMIGVSLVILTGWGGHISLGQFAIAGMGGLLAGNLLQSTELDFFLTLIAAGAAGAATAAVVGIPALRIRGLFLAVTTLAFAQALDSYLLNTANFASLLPDAIRRPLVWERFDLEGGYAMYVTCLAFLALAIGSARRLRGTRAARTVIATRDNERAAESAAVPTTRIKLGAFVLAGTIAGVAGGLHVTILHSLNSGTYAPGMSLEVFATAVIGGLGSVTGAVSGVLLFQFLASLTWLEEYRQGVTGAGLLLVLLVFPGGMAQLAAGVRDRALRVVAARRGIHVPSLVADSRIPDDDAEVPEPAVDVSLVSDALGATTTTEDDNTPTLVGSPT